MNLATRLWIGAAAIGFIAGMTDGAAFAFQDEGTVRIGDMGALSGKGYSYGLQGKGGRDIGFDEINKAGGVKIDGKMVKIDRASFSYDTGGSPIQAIALTRKMAGSDKVLLIMGPTYSSSAQSVFGILQKKLGDPTDKGLTIPVFSTESALYGLGTISPWGFRDTYDEKEMMEYAFPLLHKAFGPIKTAGVYVNRDDAYSVGTWERVFKPVLEQYDVKVAVYTEGLAQDTDFSSQVIQLKRANPDMWAISANYEAIARILVEAQRQGFRPKLMLDTGSIMAPEMFKLGGAALNGLFGESVYFPDEPNSKRVADEFFRRNGVVMTAFGADGYDGAYIIKWALEHAGIKNRPDTLEADRRKVRDTLVRLKDFKGITGVMSNKAGTGDLFRSSGIFILQMMDGRYVPWTPPAK